MAAFSFSFVVLNQGSVSKPVSPELLELLLPKILVIRFLLRHCRAPLHVSKSSQKSCLAHRRHERKPQTKVAIHVAFWIVISVKFF